MSAMMSGGPVQLWSVSTGQVRAQGGLLLAANPTQVCHTYMWPYVFVFVSRNGIAPYVSVTVYCCWLFLKYKL